MVRHLYPNVKACQSAIGSKKQLSKQLRWNSKHFPLPRTHEKINLINDLSHCKELPAAGNADGCCCYFVPRLEVDSRSRQRDSSDPIYPRVCQLLLMWAPTRLWKERTLTSRSRYLHTVEKDLVPSVSRMTLWKGQCSWVMRLAIWKCTRKMSNVILFKKDAGFQQSDQCQAVIPDVCGQYDRSRFPFLKTTSG